MSRKHKGAPIVSQWSSPLRQTGARRRMGARTGPQPVHGEELADSEGSFARLPSTWSEDADCTSTQTVGKKGSALYDYATRNTVVVPAANHTAAAEARRLASKPIACPNDSLLCESPRATLVYETGTEAGHFLCLDDGEWLLGRSPQADGHCTEPTVSRRHAQLRYAGGGYVVTDLDSRNGTFVNDQRVGSCRLKPGDTVRLGPSETLRFCHLDRAERELLANLRKRQNRDELTGVYNRRHFMRCLRMAFAGAQAWSMVTSVFLIDVRRFSTLATRHGQDTAERLLRETAACIQRVLPHEAVLCRFVEDKLAVIVSGVTQLRNGRLAALISSSVRAEVGVASPRLPIRVSIGWASTQASDYDSAEELLQAADERLWQAKQADGSDSVGEPHD